MPDAVHVIGRFPPPIDGQTLATARLAGLLKDRYDVRTASTSFPEPDGVQVEVTFQPERIAHYARVLPRLRQSLGRAPQAPVLWASVSPAPLGHLRDVLLTLPALRRGQPLYAVLHRSTFERLFRHPLTALTARLLVRRVRRFVFLSPPLAEACAPFIPPEQRTVIPNTIDDAVLCTDAEVQAKQARRPGALRLLFLSNLIRSKGYVDVLDAVALLRARGMAIEATFAGRWSDAAEEAAFRARIERHGLHDVVRAAGPVQDRAGGKALHLAADLFLLPTYYPVEAQPLAILEALNAGTPVIATAHAGIPHMVREGANALLVPPRTPEAIAAAVAQLAEPERWHRFSVAARRHFLDTFSPDAVRAQWVALLEEGERRRDG